MSVLGRLASAQGQQGDRLNQELARELAASQEAESIHELVENLGNKSSAIQSDCIKTLYEIGYLKPELIAPYAAEFVKLLRSRNNRLVWGGMIALSTAAALQADVLFPYVAEIQKAMEKGSVITMDAGVLALAGIASRSLEYNRAIFPNLLRHLETCRPKDLAQHAERTLPAVNAENKAEFIQAIEKRLDYATSAQATRLKRAIKRAEKC